MSRCEICEKPNITHRCAGLDVPMLDFCAKCAAIHRQECVHALTGFAQVVEIEKAPA